jgi:hypothetical protein
MPGLILLLLAALGTNPVPVAPGPAAVQARAFIAQVYAGYRHRNYNPLDRLDRTFAPELAAAIREDERLAKGEVDYLDGDPLCGCQDYERITATIRSLRLPSRRTASALVRVNLGIDHLRDLRLELMRTPAGWRIADVVSSEGSLLRALRRANRKR